MGLRTANVDVVPAARGEGSPGRPRVASRSLPDYLFDFHRLREYRGISTMWKTRMAGFRYLTGDG